MDCTISGVITGSGTLTTSGTTVSGGCPSCSGSHYVYYTYAIPRECINATTTLFTSVSGLEQDYVLQTQQIQDTVGFGPIDIGEGLIAWHRFVESDGYYYDWSSNTYDAQALGNVINSEGRYGQGVRVGEYPHGCISAPIPTQSGSNYMLSFWLKPSVLLTSGNNTSFRLFESDTFYGDHFADSNDYNVLRPYKGWTLLNTTTTAVAGYNSTYLRFKGASNTNWFSGTWTASTIYFNIERNRDWDIETELLTNELIGDQAAGFIFFDRLSYVNYCSLIIDCDNNAVTTYDDLTPPMDGNTSPTPYIVAATSENSSSYAAYKAFDHSNDSYGWRSNTGLPAAIYFYFGIPIYVTHYRFRSVNAADSRGFPANFTLYGSNAASPSVSDDADWVQIDQRTSTSYPGQDGYTSWFAISSPSSYTYYKIKITSVSSDTFVWIGEVEFSEYEYTPATVSVLVQTDSFSYTVSSSITQDLLSTFKLGLVKRGNIITFRYKPYYANYWLDTIYEMDCSLWSNSMALGLQSRNPSGVSPEIYFDYLSFTRGLKPDNVGDEEAPGRLIISYNETDVYGEIGVRDDSRIWAQTTRSGHAFGTSTYNWEPDTWYLLQFGFAPDAAAGDYTWWVDATRENGLLVGSGTGGSSIYYNNVINYFDSYPMPASGVFTIDEVSHWSRWLTAEEILRMLNRVSQSAWLAVADYLYGNDSFLTAAVSVSGGYGLYSDVNHKDFYYHTQYQAPLLPQAEVTYNKISYRIQKEYKVVAARIDEFVLNIFRCSSGWITNMEECFNCANSSACLCDVRGGIAIYTLPFWGNQFNKLFHIISRQKYNYNNVLLIRIDTLTGQYSIMGYDLNSPYPTSLIPANNQRMIHPELLWQDEPNITIEISDFGGNLAEDRSRVWIKRENVGYNTFTKIDDFCFYEEDFKLLPTYSGSLGTTVSGNGWTIVNIDNTISCKVNDNFNSNVVLDYTDIVASGVEGSLTTSGLNDSLETIKNYTYYYNPECSISGTRNLEVITTSGAWSSILGNNLTAPFAYQLIPSTVSGWDFITKVNSSFEGDTRGQYCGLMAASPTNNTKYTQLLLSPSGVILRPTPTLSGVYINTGKNSYDPIWFKINKNNNVLKYYWSLTGSSWTQYTSVSGESFLNTNNLAVGPVVISERAGYDTGVTKAWFEFVKFTTSGNNTSEINFNNGGWELLLEGSYPVNSIDNSGYVSYTKVADYRYILNYEPKESFVGGEQVYVRTESHDVPSFKIDYSYGNDLLLLKGDGVHGQVVDSNYGELGASGINTAFIFDSSSYNLKTYSVSGTNSVTTTTGIKYLGNGSFYFPTNIGLTTEAVPYDLSTTNWTFHTWINTTSTSGSILSFLPITGNSFICKYYSSRLNFLSGTTLLGSGTIFTIPTGWNHLGVMRNNDYLYGYFNGKMVASSYIGNITLATASGSRIKLMGDNITGYLDMVTLKDSPIFSDTLVSTNDLDIITSFNIASSHGFEVTLNCVTDDHAPVVVPVDPVPYQQLICPSSGIVFDILDDFTGVKWTQTSIIIDGITVWSGGNNMTDYFDDRGTLIYEETGEKGGEWADTQGTSFEKSDGINRLLYPPGTVYSGSGAWGRRYTYYLPDATQINYFGRTINITISGTDDFGYLSYLDSFYPNEFSYDYEFSFIYNTNIQFANCFMVPGESYRIDEIEARGWNFCTDIFDSEYPVTDIDDAECYINFNDGINQFTASGTWMTTWTGELGTTSGVFHRIQWYPDNHWNWGGNRAMYLTIEAHNTHPYCDVYNTVEYIYYYGKEIWWYHTARRNDLKQYPPFDLNHKLPVLIGIKTQDFIPETFFRSYLFWTHPGKTYDLGVTLKAIPKPTKDLKVGILAHSHYLQYSEDVDVEIYCKDLDGNEITYTWIFTTEDKPN